MADPMFWIDPVGNLAVEAVWRKPVAGLCVKIREVVGENAMVSYWPYRAGLTPYVALDIEGDSGEINLTIMESEVNELPSAEMLESQGDCECRVMDMVDAYYLVVSVLKSLEDVTSSILAGPKKILIKL